MWSLSIVINILLLVVDRMDQSRYVSSLNWLVEADAAHFTDMES